MGQHTWFYKNKDKYLQMQEIYKEADEIESYDELRAEALYNQTEELRKENEANYHDCFRTSKRNKDGTYTDDVIFSKKECDEWLENNKETIYDLNKEQLNKFWEEYPNGVIEFG